MIAAFSSRRRFAYPTRTAASRAVMTLLDASAVGDPIADTTGTAVSTRPSPPYDWWIATMEEP